MKYIDPDTQNAWGILQEICGWIVGYSGDLWSGRVAQSKTGHNRVKACGSVRDRPQQRRECPTGVSGVGDVWRRPLREGLIPSDLPANVGDGTFRDLHQTSVRELVMQRMARRKKSATYDLDWGDLVVI